MTARCATHAVDTTRQPATDCVEEGWLDRARAGDERAFAWLLGRYRERAVRLATQVMGHSGEGEDAAQEAFIRAFRSIRRLRPGTRFYAWLYPIVVRICLDRRRLARWEMEILCDCPGSPSGGSGDGPAVERLCVESLLGRLSPPLRAAVVLRELEGLEYEEIAEALDLPVGTVRSRLHAARARLREMYTAMREEADRV